MRQTLFLLTVVGTLAACAPQVAPGRDSALHNMVVVLEETPSGCRKTIDLDREVRTKRQGILRWYILNLCNARQTVAIRFTEKDPTVPPTKEDAVDPVDSNGNVRLGRINATVLPDPPQGDDPNSEKTYPYQVLVNGTPSDPEIIIDWRVRSQ